jgi:hypothetical protein
MSCGDDEDSDQNEESEEEVATAVDGWTRCVNTFWRVSFNYLIGSGCCLPELAFALDRSLRKFKISNARFATILSAEKLGEFSSEGEEDEEEDEEALETHREKRQRAVAASSQQAPGN